MKSIIFYFIGIAFVFFLLSYFLLSSTIASDLPFSRLAQANFLFDKPSPGNWIKESQIIVYEDRIVILIPGATLSRYAPTKSMDPTLDSSANGIEIEPTSPEQIHVGDIIVYQSNDDENELIVHRVISIGYDSKGWYCITKGDNSPIADSKVRFEQIKFVTIAIIY